MTSRRLGICVLVLLALAGCEHVEADHPLDPYAEPDVRHRARVIGRVVVPAAVPNEDVEVALFPVAESSSPAYLESLRDDDGHFVFEVVTAQTYRLEVHAPGFQTAPMVLPLAPSQVVDVGDLVLRASP
jgi:hypothetical protein